jgi:NADPH-dependent curcumin reductase CurA
MRRAEMAVQSHPVGNSLDQPARAGPVGIPLVAVNQLVREHACNLVGEAGGADGVDVVQGEVDFLVVIV